MSGVRVGLVGAGWIAREHRRVLDDAADAELAAVCDTDLDRARALAAGTGARTYADWRGMLDREDLGALFVCTPPRAHREPAVAALRSGLPVYLEKPVARTLADAAAIVAAATGTVCAVGYQWHALDLLLELPGLLAGQQIGLLAGTSIGPTQSRPWFTDMSAGGGNLLERGSHHLDLIRAVAGEVTAVQAAASRIRLARGADEAGDIDDALTLMLSLASGALATVVIAWTRAGQPGSYGLDIVASEATLRLALDPDFTLSGVSGGEPVDLRAAAHPFGRSVRCFLDAVRDGDPAAVACTPTDAAATLAVAAAAEQALRTARSVPVEASLVVAAGNAAETEGMPAPETPASGTSASGQQVSIGRSEAWPDANPRSRALSRRARRVLPGGVTHDVRRAAPFPLAVARAQGARKWDLDGHEIICYVMGHGALLLGHCDPEVVAAVQHQATLAFHPGAGHELECEWAELVTELVPAAELVRFTASGTEATLLALRLARSATGRERVVKLAGHFHGWHDQVSFGTDAPFRGPDTAGVPSALEPVVTVVPADAGAVADALADRDVAAVILEPSGAAWGTVPLPAGLLGAVRELTAATGTVLVFDEVVSGFRWSPGGVQAVAEVTPDLAALGKILAGGMPGGAVAGRADLLGHLARPGDDPRRVAHPGTHNAHPLSAAAGIATLRRCRSGEPQEHAAGLAASLRSGLTSVLAKAGVPGRAYGESSTFHLLIGDAGEPERAGMESLKAAGMSPQLSAELHNGMLLEGVQLFHGSGFLSSAHTEQDVDRTVAAFAATLARLPAALLP